MCIIDDIKLRNALRKKLKYKILLIFVDYSLQIYLHNVVKKHISLTIYKDIVCKKLILIKVLCF